MRLSARRLRCIHRCADLYKACTGVDALNRLVCSTEKDAFATSLKRVRNESGGEGARDAAPSKRRKRSDPRDFGRVADWRVNAPSDRPPVDKGGIDACSALQRACQEINSILFLSIRGGLRSVERLLKNPIHCVRLPFDDLTYLGYGAYFGLKGLSCNDHERTRDRIGKALLHQELGKFG